MKTRTLMATAMGVLFAGLTYAQQPAAVAADDAPIFGAQIMTCLLYTSPSPRD